MSVCEQCNCYKGMGFKIKMAFQPIVQVQKKEVYAYEALVRGADGEGAGEVLARVNSDNIYSFDQTCRTTAIETASKLKMQEKLSINFLPNAIYEPETCLERTFRMAKKLDFPHHNIIFEVTEHERVENHSLLLEVFETYKRNGFLTAIDDFGEGYAGLNLLAEFQPDMIKLDMALIRNIHERRVSQTILRGILSVARELEICIVAEGVETHDEYSFLFDQGIQLMQGYYFSQPLIEGLTNPFTQRTNRLDSHCASLAVPEEN